MINFDPDKHEYSKDNIIIPGVTTVLKEVGIIDYGPFVTPGKGARFHKIIQNYIEGSLNWEAISTEEMEKIQKFTELTKDYQFTECEKILYNKAYVYAGTCDYDSEKYIGELKDGKPEPWHLLQLAAYVYNFPGTKQGVLIYIDVKKNPVRIYPMKELRDSFKHFLCALDVYNFRRLCI